jgi:hypothetical protein
MFLNNNHGLAVLVLFSILLLSACQTVPPLAQLTPILTATAPQSQTPTVIPIVEKPTNTPTPVPSHTPVPTRVPTYSPSQLLTSANNGLQRVLTFSAGRELVCLRYEDLDADGLPEWLALTYQEDTPANLQAFILDGETHYVLEPAQPEPGMADIGFGQFPFCDVLIKDINLDGRLEIALFGHAQQNETLLHLFTWDEVNGKYTRLGYFSGDAGVKFNERDGDLALEIWEGYRVHEAPALTWYVIHTWQEQTYGWTSDCYSWYSQERPHTYPTHEPDFAVISFYLALDDRDLPNAYDLILPQSRTSYENWAIGYATTIRVYVGGVHTVPGSVSASRAKVAAMVTSYDNQGGIIIRRLWNVEWDTAYTQQGWRLLSSTAELLEESKATYFP